MDWVGVPPVVPPGSWSTGPYFYTGSVYVPLGAAIAQEYPQLVETESNSAPPGYTDSAPRRPVLVSIGTRDVRFEYRLPLARPRQLHRAPLRLRLEMELRGSSGSDRCSRQVGLAVTRWVVFDGENLEQGRNVPGAPAY